MDRHLVHSEFDKSGAVSEPESESAEVSILAVVVLYQKQPSASPAVRSVCESVRLITNSGVKVRVLIYDNTPGGQIPAGVPDEAEYWVAKENTGVSGAYNWALEIAEKQGFDWLLTLDHDTTLPCTFLEHVADAVKQIARIGTVVAIVPQVYHGNVFISPHFTFRKRSVRIPDGFVGLPEGPVSAINSGTTWRVQFLRELGGFHPLFWLDCLDAWVYHRIEQIGKQVYAIGDVRVEHQLSLLDRHNGMSLERLENYLLALSAFCDLYKSRSVGLMLTGRLLMRFGMQTLQRQDPRVRRLTWKCVKDRLFLRREIRIDRWKQSVTECMTRMNQRSERPVGTP